MTGRLAGHDSFPPTVVHPSDPSSALSRSASAPSTTSRIPTPGASPTPIRLPLLLLGVSIIICLLGYAALGLPGVWSRSAETKAWPVADIRATRGHAAAERDALVVAANDASNTVILTVKTTPFRSASYPVIAWSGIAIPEQAEVRLLWRNDYAPDKFNAAPITVASGRLL